jgi:hypothetical protein
MGDELEPGQQQGELITLKNGAVYDRSKGRIVANPPGGPSTAISQSNTDDMRRLRAEKYRQAAAAGLGRVPGGPGSPVAAWGWLIEKQAALAADIEKGRSSTEAARFVGTAIGVLGGKNEPESGSNVPGGVLPGDTLRRLLADLRVLREQLGDGDGA